MGISIHQLMSSAFFSQNHITLCAGEDGIGRKIEYVTLCNSPILSIPNYYVGEEVLVLTSFSAYYSSVANMKRVIKFLSAQHIAALCVKTDTYLHGNVPHEIIELCDELQLPLLCCNDHNIPFKKIIHEVEKEILGQEIFALEKANRQYSVLYQAILNGETVDTYLERLGSSLHCSCAAVSCGCELLGYFDFLPAKETAAYWRDLVAAIMGKMDAVQSQFEQSGTAYLANTWIYSCYVHGKMEGLLFVVSNGAEPSEDAADMIKETCTFVSGKLLEAMVLAQMLENNSNDAIKFLFDDHITEENKRRRLNLLGINECGSYRIIGFTCKGADKESFLGLKHRWSFLESNLKRTFPSLISTKTANIFLVSIFYSSLSKYNNDQAVQERLYEIANSEFAGKDVKASFSRNYAQLSDFSSAVESVQEALGFTWLLDDNKFVYSYYDILQLKIVSNFMRMPEYNDIKDRIIRPIKEYDKLSSAGLWDTLQACLKTDSLVEACNLLFVHKSTLRYRLSKIAALTGQNYFTTAGKFMLQVASISEKVKQADSLL